MDQQPDKLFRNKLQGYDPAVPPQTWSRVAANVPPKHKAVWWLSAAAVALIASAAVFIYPLTKGSTEVAETVTQAPRQEQSLTIIESDANAVPSEQAIVKKERATQAPAAKANADGHPSRKSNSQPNNNKQLTAGRDELPVMALPENAEPVAIAKEEPIPPSVTEETNAQENHGRKTMTIVFSAKEVNEKYLSKTAPAHATSAAEEASTLKNMLDKAYDLTHNQSPLGDLRQKKNEILAMNFRKDKPRRQND